MSELKTMIFKLMEIMVWCLDKIIKAFSIVKSIKEENCEFDRDKEEEIV